MSKYQNTNEHFEQLLQQEAEKYRMYPSEKVWENIRVEMHGKQKWRALPIIFTIILCAITIATVINYPPKKFLVKDLAVSELVTAPVKLNHMAAVSNHTANSNFIEKKNIVKTGDDNFLTEVLNDYVNSLPDNNYTVQQPANTDVVKQNQLTFNGNHDEAKVSSPVSNTAIEEAAEDITETVVSAMIHNNGSAISEAPSVTENNNSTEAALVSNENNLAKNISTLTNSKDADAYLNNLKKTVVATPKTSRWSVQYYATISNSYRKLEDDKTRLNYITNPQEREALNGNVNDIVRHKPSIGGEFGLSFLYNFSKRLYIKSGIQFNIREYDIDAHKVSGDALISYVQNGQLNSYTVKSGYSTQGTDATTRLENSMYQISVPIGLQWDVVEGERWGVSLAATMQPTFTVNKNLYIVSTDYKNYADGNSFFRRANVNTSTELYLTLKGKSGKWFFGPQIRYQQMPTYNDLYPIKEYRVDYGIKFGFTKALK